MLRLFTAVEIPEHVREHLARLRAPLPGARWVAPEDMHVTLRFAGDVDNTVASEFAHALAGIGHERFTVHINGLGAFGGRNPRTLFAGVDGGEALVRLARANERAARSAGLAPEGRAYTPHVTLARLRNTRAEAVARFLERSGAVLTEPFTVDRFVLFSARPQSGGPPYVVEDVFPLSGPGFAREDEADVRS